MLRHSYQFTINGGHFFVPVIFSPCVQSQNLIMLQHLSDIARSKRINDGNTKKMHWKDFYLQIVVNPRSVLCTLGVIKICALVFREFLSSGCINFKNLCAHHQKEVLRFPKHPQLVKFK